eukprot:Nk52_evm2s1240 gene=Nk52_evmTU2s1240
MGGKIGEEFCEIPAGVEATKPLFFEDTYRFEETASVVYVSPRACEEGISGEFVVILDQTIMYPQGGGQPFDLGEIKSSTCSFKVKEVRNMKNGVVAHIGLFEGDNIFCAGDNVTVCVDSTRRVLNARLHSAGHLMDAALKNIGKDDLIPTKGYHFEDAPYVEYQGSIPVEERDEVKAKLNEECQRLIEENEAVTKRMEGETRYVTIAGLEGMCGGTHVSSTGEIKKMTVTRLKKNKKLMKMSYALE